MMPVHAFASMSGQQGGMQVDHAAVVGVDEETGYHQQKACKDNEVYVMFAQQRHQHVLVIELGAVEHLALNAQTTGALEHAGLAVVAKHQRHAGCSALVEVVDYVLKVSASA